MLNAGIKGYSGARGLLGALKARGPRPALVEDLLNMSDAANCASYLRSLPFVQGVDTGASAGELEKGLRAACMVFGRKLSSFLGGASQDFMESYLLRYSVENVRVLFRRALVGQAQAGGEPLYPQAEVYASPRERASLDAVEKVVDFTKGTALEKPVQAAYELYHAAGGDVFIFELSLDAQYANMLWAAANRVYLYEGSRLLRRVVIPQLSTNAVVWGMWLKVHHGMKPEEIMTRLHVPADVIRPDRYLGIIKAEDAGAAAAAVKAGPLREFLAAKEPLGDVALWHRLSRRYIWGLLGARELGILFDITTLVIALMRWEFIVDDAITVTAAKSMGLGRDEIVPLLTTQAA
jgi:vacuolar-type H+-ATPase subunit C/Vma6